MPRREELLRGLLPLLEELCAECRSFSPLDPGAERLYGPFPENCSRECPVRELSARLERELSPPPG